MNTNTPKPTTPQLRGPFRKRTLRQHILRRLMLVLPISVLVIVLAKSGVLDTLTDRYTFRPESWFDDTALVRHLRVTVTHNGMTQIKPDCLLFVVNGNDPPTASRIDVMQKTSGSCPGPKGELPKLFTLRIDRMNHVIMSDQGSPTLFHPIP
ncbi:hypothetical protein [Acetobacter orleanensis]|uniref:Uncharacterized protein n=1 Tax=Acetobacter orleanensis TaxID=104099 RepID=A0A4Y3TPH7_9PROT|nr:hypothetical protein [Acetobacter orleanensis]KXV63561.1 hypothetical protein AD949_07160 [Acetobacter orleanensis]PCD79873.1 hypothetical protein CO710_03110 [Acetobacter orleanensis]GAN68170.1 hypothetical protein Abol_015_009 [Acetobacter orleanensis JCM 7639]GBR31532.1 hypothetical protein AA0473_2568 [Acetobacter orleanensis NRIC 0473]GEB82937.1 hypothetical protein AOR01nite_14140 [Acetobacter orleanensis]